MIVTEFFQKEIYADENGHILPSNQKVLRYVNQCSEYSFLQRKYLEIGNGVTYKLIGIQMKKIKKEKKEKNMMKKKEEVLKNIFIEEVVNENKIKFFREPILGCYFAIDIRYNSSLNYNALKVQLKIQKIIK